MSEKYTVPIIEVDGELAFEIPDEIMNALNLKVGDTLEWTQLITGEWKLTKAVK